MGQSITGTCREYNAAVHTYTGVAPQNKLHKYTYLQRRKNITLSELLTVLTVAVDTYLTESHQKYT